MSIAESQIYNTINVAHLISLTFIVKYEGNSTNKDISVTN